MSDRRFDRQLALLGSEGQASIRSATVAVIGVGGIGSVVIQNLAIVGVGGIAVVEDEELDETNRNRHVCARHDDPIPGTLKVDIAERLIHAIDPGIRICKVGSALASAGGFEAVRRADYVLGCVDSEGARLVLTELCAAYAKPYIDVASDVIPDDPPRYGGRVCCALDGRGCLVCLGLLDVAEAQEDLETPGQRRQRAAIYGVPAAALDRSGPSVVTINTVVAGLAATEFLKLCTGLERPVRLLNYDGRSGKVTVSLDEPTSDCYFCKSVWGSGASADVERFLRRRSA